MNNICCKNCCFLDKTQKFCTKNIKKIKIFQIETSFCSDFSEKTSKKVKKKL